MVSSRKGGVNIANLAKFSKKLAFYCRRHGQDRSSDVAFPFDAPAAVAALNEAIAMAYCGISFRLDPTRLIPAIPGRLEYVCCLQDVMLSSRWLLTRPSSPCDDRGGWVDGAGMLLSHHVHVRGAQDTACSWGRRDGVRLLRRRRMCIKWQCVTTCPTCRRCTRCLCTFSPCLLSRAACIKRAYDMSDAELRHTALCVAKLRGGPVAEWPMRMEGKVCAGASGSTREGTSGRCARSTRDNVHVKRWLSITSARALDVGTGASAVLARLGAAVFGWQCSGTDVDDDALSLAEASVNGHHERVELVNAVTSDAMCGSRFFPSVSTTQADKDSNGALYDCSVCNPPFYGSLDEKDGASGGAANKRTRGIYAGRMHETVWSQADDGEGSPAADRSIDACSKAGDLGFVERMYQASTSTPERVVWFSSMFGRRASADAFAGRLMDDMQAPNAPRGDGNAHPTCAVRLSFCLGRTRRHIICWTFA